MNNTTKTAKTINGATTSNENHQKRTFELKGEEVNQSKENKESINTEKKTQEYKTSHNIYCFEGFVFRHHD